MPPLRCLKAPVKASPQAARAEVEALNMGRVPENALPVRNRPVLQAPYSAAK
jgi:hypothetical protein